jgi:hypothetical protein
VEAARDAKRQHHYGSAAFDEALLRLEHAENDCRRRGNTSGMVQRIGALEAQVAKLTALLGGDK